MNRERVYQMIGVTASGCVAYTAFTGLPLSSAVLVWSGMMLATYASGMVAVIQGAEVYGKQLAQMHRQYMNELAERDALIEKLNELI